MGSQTQIRLYDDNFGIWNDGGLPAELTEDDLKRTHRSKPGNPIIADVCFKAGYIDTWGRGTIKIIEACKEHNLPEPVLKEEQGGFLTKIFKDIFTKENLEKLGLNDRQIKGVLYTKEKGSINNSLYQELNGIGKTTATEELQELVQKGILLQTGTKGRGIKYTIS